jgi:hypothetical protein
MAGFGDLPGHRQESFGGRGRTDETLKGAVVVNIRIDTDGTLKAAIDAN